MTAQPQRSEAEVAKSLMDILDDIERFSDKWKPFLTFDQLLAIEKSFQKIQEKYVGDLENDKNPICAECGQEVAPDEETTRVGTVEDEIIHKECQGFDPQLDCDERDPDMERDIDKDFE